MDEIIKQQLLLDEMQKDQTVGTVDPSFATALNFRVEVKHSQSMIRSIIKKLTGLLR